MGGRVVDFVDIFTVCGLVVGSTPRENTFRLQKNVKNN